jgi:Ser/Thr protein kinase RdoA (MazF antagonist)
MEISLIGGRTTAGVVRIGDTVRRPRTANSDFVSRLLMHLEQQGFAGAPRYLGNDALDRDVLTFLPGTVPPELGEWSPGQLTAAAQLLRSFHDATAGFEAKGGYEIICHGDASPCNCVFVDGVPFAFIDFDDAHPGSRLEDLGYASWLWLDIGNAEYSGQEQTSQLATFFSDYGMTIESTIVEPVLAAQKRLRDRTDASTVIREWADRCHTWTLEHLSTGRA